MEVKEFYRCSPEERERLVAQVLQSDWDTGRYLGIMMHRGITDEFGKDPVILLLCDGERVASFCTYVEIDEIVDDSMKPWIGFVYTFPAYRGRRCAGQLIEYAVGLAKKQGHKSVYVSSEENGLYEKYGFTFLKDMESMHGYTTHVFIRPIGADA